MSHGIMVQAHRGLSADLPENTLAAFQAAAEAGFTGMELDVRITADHEVVVLHDSDLARTTDGAGRIEDVDYAAVAAMDTGAGPPPRLHDVLAALEAWSGTWNIEVKDMAATAPALDLLAAHALERRSLVSSMDPAVLEVAHAHAPDIPRGLITLGPPDDEDIEEAKAIGCRWLHVDHDFLDEHVMEQAVGHEMKVGAWTVNDADEAHRMVALGAVAIITDERAVLDALI